MQLFDRQGKRLYLTAEERAAFMAAARKAPPDVRTLCAVLHDTGCRESELLEVTPQRVDLAGGCLVFRTLKKRREGVYRAVPVPPATLPTISTSCIVSGRPSGAGKGMPTGLCGPGPG